MNNTIQAELNQDDDYKSDFNIFMKHPNSRPET